MAGYIEDRWFKKGPPDPDDPKQRPTKAPTARHGQGKRWRVAGIPGVRNRSFEKLEGEHGAKAWLKQAATDNSRGEFYDPRDGSITLDEYVRTHWWPTLRKSPTTKLSMRSRIFNHILPHVGQMPLNRIGFDEIKAWQTRAEQNIDVGTLVVTWAHFSSILQAAHKAKRIPANPFRDSELRAPRLPKSKALAWSQDAVASVQEQLPERYRILVSLAVGAGLRQGEALGFSPDDIDGEDIRIVRQIVKVNGHFGFGPPKGNKERTTPCAPELAKAVKEYANRFPTVEVTLPWVDPDRPSLAWEDRPKRTVRLLVTTQFRNGVNGGAVNKDTFNDKHWKPALADAGLIPSPEVTYVEPKQGVNPWRKETWAMPREFGFHVLRHTFASVALAAGETITQLAAWLGHSDPAFTLRTYVHFMPKSGSRGRAALGSFLSGAAVAEVEPPETDEEVIRNGSPQILPSARGS
jgi:integrase